jgi:hypothetical protein
VIRDKIPHTQCLQRKGNLNRIGSIGLMAVGSKE